MQSRKDGTVIHYFGKKAGGSKRGRGCIVRAGAFIRMNMVFMWCHDDLARFWEEVQMHQLILK